MSSIALVWTPRLVIAMTSSPASRRCKPHAFGRAAGAADVGDANADHLIARRDQQHFVAGIDENLIDDRTDVFFFGERFDALAAARSVPVVIDRRALAECVRRDDQDFAAVGFFDVHRDDRISGRQRDRANAARHAAHRSDVFLGKVNRHTVFRAEDDVIRTIRDIDGEQFVVVVEADRVKAAAPNVRELAHRRLLDDAAARDHHEIFALFECADRQARR